MATASSSPADRHATGGLDEFGEIVRLFRPLTRGAPEALDLMDDAAAIPLPGGETLVVTTDTVVEGVHAPVGEAPGLIARKLLRVNLSDLAAKAAEPYGFFLNVAWPPDYGRAEREAFAAGLALDVEAFGLPLMGGDTVRTSGPLVATATLLGKAPMGGFIARDGARAGDVLLVTGAVGDAVLGLSLALGATVDGLSEDERTALLARYRLPHPRLNLRAALRAHAVACADISDGCLADAGCIALASALGVEIALECAPLSPAAQAWLQGQPDEAAARLRLATGGDDYELAVACRPQAAAAFQAAARAAGVPATVIGAFSDGEGLAATFHGRPVRTGRLGYAHR